VSRAEYRDNIMSLVEENELRAVTGISEIERARISDFLQGAVYCWCKNKPKEWFSLRDLMGGANFDWRGTPLQPLFLKHEGVNEDPTKEAGKDCGWLLKSVIANDRRVFDTKKEELTRKYLWMSGDGDT